MTDDAFVTHRNLLFTVAYEMLGSAADAEDVVQETWLRWARVDRAEVREPRAYLVRIVTRQALNRLRTLARRREEYVGEWLPEPLLTSPDVAEDVEFAEAMSETPPRVTDELSDRLLEQLGPAAMVELVAWVGFANMTTRSNTTLGIESQEFSKSCALPLAQPA